MFGIKDRRFSGYSQNTNMLLRKLQISFRNLKPGIR